MAMTKPNSSQVTYGNSTVQRVLSKTALQYATLGEAQAAAAALPDGQVVDVAETKTRYDATSGSLVNQRPITPFSVETGVVRSVQDKLAAELVSVKDFGAIGDGNLHPLSEKFSTLTQAKAVYPHATSLSQSIDWAATVAAITSGASKVYAPGGHYVMTDNARIIAGVDLDCAGVDYWDSYRPNPAELPKSDAKGTHWYFVGTGAKSFTCDDLSNVLPAKTVGGVTYDFTKFTLEDSVAGEPATPRPFSVGFIVERNASLTNCRVIPSYNKLQGYIDGTGLSDEWDVGVWALSSNDCNIENVQSVGHWRMAGVLITEHEGTSQGPRNNERTGLRRVWGSGVRGLLVRNTPQYEVTAWTSNTVTVKWNQSFTLTRINKFRIGSITHTYTGYTFDSGTSTVTLTGVSPNISSNPGTLRAWNMGNNLSNTILQNCIFSSLDHQTRQPSESFGLPIAGAAEYDGFPLRNMVHVNTVFQTTADKLNTLWGGVYDFKYVACKHENGEKVAYSNTESPYFTMNLRFVAEDGIIDWATMGGFNPRAAYIDSYQIPQTFTDGTYTQRPLVGKKLELQNQASQTVFRTNATNGDVYLSNGADTASIQLQDSSFAAYRADVFRYRTSAGTTDLLRVDGTTLSCNVAPYFGQTGRPLTDNTISWGTGANRWSVIFAGTGTINTSDAREKTAPAPIEDSLLDAWGEVQYVTFNWLKSVAEKGELARKHYGVIAQQVRDVLVKYGYMQEGSTDCRHGPLCYDEWGDEYAPVMALRDVEREVIEVIGVNDDGTPIEKTSTVVEQEEYDTGEVQLVRAAGNRWGIRADQCLFLEAAYQRRRADRIEQRLAALEARFTD